MEHKLSEQEIDLIVDKLCDKIEKRLYLNVGKGLVGILWKGIMVILIAIAGYGLGGHFFK